MPWCPKCKLEYVEGIKVCPDCKTALLDTLDGYVEESPIDDYTDMFEEAEEELEEVEETPHLSINIFEMIQKVQNGEMSEEEFRDVINALRSNNTRTKAYDSKEDLLNENKSSIGVLLGVGVVGIVALVLISTGIIHIPIRGFSLWLVDIVMGILFASFIFSGIHAAKKVNSLKEDVAKEDELIKKCVEFLKERNEAHAFDINDEVSYEEAALIKSEMCVQALESEFEELEEGFAFYVTDRYYSDIFGEE